MTVKELRKHMAELPNDTRVVLKRGRKEYDIEVLAIRVGPGILTSLAGPSPVVLLLGEVRGEQR